MNTTLEPEESARAKLSVGRTTWNSWQKLGLIPPGVKIGPRAVRYPSHEINSIVSARIAGKSDADIRALVVELVAARQGQA